MSLPANHLPHALLCTPLGTACEKSSIDDIGCPTWETSIDSFLATNYMSILVHGVQFGRLIGLVDSLLPLALERCASEQVC